MIGISQLYGEVKVNYQDYLSQMHSALNQQQNAFAQQGQQQGLGAYDTGFISSAPNALAPNLPTKQPEKKSMFKEITTDIKGFLLEHRGVIYFIAAALILDHFFFRGAFKARLQGMADKVVTKVEEKIQ